MATATDLTDKDREEIEAMQKRVQHFFDLKAKGEHVNEHIRRSRDFSNPYCMKELIAMWEIDEYATNFDPKVYDPSIYLAVQKPPDTVP